MNPLYKVSLNEMKRELGDKGYYKCPDFLTETMISSIKNEIRGNVGINYNQDNLSTNAVYISDKSDGRESHAMMVSQEEGSLPSVSLYGKTLPELLRFHDFVLGFLTGEDVSPQSRSMMNFQLYYGESKPVAEHYDGHYMDYEKVSPTEFKLKEGLLPRYVMVFNIENENGGEGNGTHFRNVETGEIFSPRAEAGSFIIFDNLKVRHWVPRLTKPRVMLGFRNFDHLPWYFRHTLMPRTEDNYKPLNDANNPGYIMEVSTDTGLDILSVYYKHTWPRHWEEIKKEGAVF